MVRIGDKVRFLNSTGGGIVTKIVKNIVHVEEKDGFETPVLLTECVVIESSERYNAQPSGNVPKTLTAPPTKAVQPAPQVRIVETKEGEKLNIFLAYVPEDRRKLQNGQFDTYLVNDSNFYLNFSYMSQTENGWKMRYSGTVEPNIKMHLEEFSLTQLNELENVCIQYIAYKLEKTFAVKPAVSVELHIDTVKFYKLHSFKESDYFDEEALMFPITVNDIPCRPLVVDPEELQLALQEKRFEEKIRKQPITKKENRNESLLEIDLHITELLDTTAGMSNGEMLEYQKNEFLKTMEQHKNNKGQKIVFIHGKGDGVLRNEIIKELRNKYKQCHYQDASFREYGFGATLITIK